MALGNFVMLSGTLVGAPVIRPTGGVCTFEVRITKRVFDHGEWSDNLLGDVPCFARDQVTAGVMRYLQAGMRVTLSGKLRFRPRGHQRVLEVEVDDIGPSLRLEDGDD